MKRLCITLAALAMAFMFVNAAMAEDQDVKVPGKSDTLKWAEAHFKYVGEKSCKMCHKAEFESWSTTKHAQAWAALKLEEQKKPECAACHTTGKTATDSMLVNVACESCHGPGSDFKSMKVMKDAKLAAAAGLLPITEATCVRCHNKKSPNFKGFEFAAALKAGIHAHPVKTAAPTTGAK